MESFEEALFSRILEADEQQQGQEQQQNNNGGDEKAQANMKQAQEDNDAAKKAQGEHEWAQALSQSLGLEQGQTLTPDEVLEKLRSDPEIIQNIAGSEEVCSALKMKSEDILKLKDAVSLQQPDEANGDAPEEVVQATLTDEKAQDKTWGFIRDELNKLLNPECQQQNGGNQ
mgnify:CR=1 FL=1